MFKPSLPLPPVSREGPQVGPLLYPLRLSQGKKAQAGVAFHLGSGVRG